MSDNVRAHQERESIMTKTSRFNYIKRGLVGVCAATMLTGLCAGTAFAVDPVPDEPSAYAPGTSTSVNAELDNTNISATVPTSISAKIDSTGKIFFPTTAQLRNASTLYGIEATATAASTAGNLVGSGETFTNATQKNSFWAKIGKDTATEEMSNLSNLALKIPAATDSSTPSSITLAFDGAIKNVNATSFSPLVTITWTVGIDKSAS